MRSWSSGRAAVRRLLEPDRRCSRWLVAGLLAGVILAPAAAVAATLSTVRIVGTDGVTVSVASSGQLATAAVSPNALHVFHFYNLSGSTCDAVYTSPHGSALVLETITVDVYSAGSPGPGVNLRVASNASCRAQLADVNPSTVGATSIGLSPGVVIPAGKSLYAIGDNNAAAELYGYGYLVPAADAPVGTSAQPGNNTRTSPAAPNERAP
jgi:hypothetical protein